MDTVPALTLASVIAVIVVAALTKPTKTLVSGLLTKDKKGRLVLVLTPARRKKKRRR
jgi:hypothetical protein